MADWADEAADEACQYSVGKITRGVIASALRQARADALEEAAQMLEAEIDPFGDNPANYDTCAQRIRQLKDNR